MNTIFINFHPCRILFNILLFVDGNNQCLMQDTVTTGHEFKPSFKFYSIQVTAAPKAWQHPGNRTFPSNYIYLWKPRVSRVNTLVGNRNLLDIVVYGVTTTSEYQQRIHLWWFSFPADGYRLRMQHDNSFYNFYYTLFQCYTGVDWLSELFSL